MDENGKELDGYELSTVIQTFRHYRSYRQSKEHMWNLIRDLHNGEFWKKVAKKQSNSPQIKPDTNYLEYVESNITNSVYAANYHANVLPRHFKDNDDALALNAFIDYKWDKIGMKSIFPKLGKSATLYNFAAVQMSWDPEQIGGSKHNREQGSVSVDFIPHHELYLDGSVTDYQSGRAIFINREVTLFDLLVDPVLKEGAKAYKDKIKNENNDNFVSQSTEQHTVQQGEQDTVNEYSKKVQLLEAYFKVEDEESPDNWRIDHIYIADQKYVLEVEEDIRPKEFPIRVLYGQEPDSDPYGIPLAWKIVGNTVALNLLDSIEGTHAYATQNRAKLFSHNSGINYRAFAKYGNTPNMAFIVRGNPDDVVRYVDVQELPSLDNLKIRLQEAIQLVTGVDPRYIGRETGSIQTTGGTDMAQERIMSTTDATRIVSLENFTEELTKLMVDFYIEFGKEYSTSQRDAIGKAKEIDVDNKPSYATVNFKKIEENKFDYSMHAAPYLPRNTMRLAEAADKIMEMQGQYQWDPPLITHREWLQYQNFPQKELMIQRLRGQEQDRDKDKITATLLSFAGMVDKGMSEEDAIETLVQEEQQKRDEPSMGISNDPGQQGPGMGGMGI